MDMVTEEQWQQEEVDLKHVETREGRTFEASHLFGGLVAPAQNMAIPPAANRVFLARGRVPRV